MCSFWDEEEEDWSQDGCVLVSGITSSDDRSDEEIVRCACDHLTNFAVIMVSEKQLGNFHIHYHHLTTPPTTITRLTKAKSYSVIILLMTEGYSWSSYRLNSMVYVLYSGRQCEYITPVVVRMETATKLVSFQTGETILPGVCR